MKRKNKEHEKEEEGRRNLKRREGTTQDILRGKEESLFSHFKCLQVFVERCHCHGNIGDALEEFWMGVNCVEPSCH